MKGRLLFSVFFTICSLIAVVSSAQSQDTLFLKNGQVLTGDIKNMNLGVIVIDDMDLNTLNIKQHKIKSISTVRRFKIETTNKEIYYGSLNVSGKDSAIIQISDTEKVTVKFIEISEIIPLERKFFKRLDGNLTAGFSFSKSTGIGQFNLSTQVKYVTRLFQNQLTLSSISSIDTVHFTRDNENAELFSNFSLGPKWFLAGLLGYQRNLELSIEFRFQEMLGAGNKLIVTKDLQLLAISGMALNQEKSTTGAYEDLLIEVPLMLRFDFFKFKNPNIQISTTQTAYIGITQLGRFRFNGSTTISYEIIHDFSFSLNIYNNYDNQPPSATPSNIDYGIVLGVTYKF
jgi:hypothetical protein